MIEGSLLMIERERERERKRERRRGEGGRRSKASTEI